MFTTRISTNQPPYAPRNPFPPDSANQQPVSLTLLWTGGDPNVGDIVTYAIYLDTLSSPSIFVTAHPSTSYPVVGLKFAKLYYWRIVAKDAEGATTAGALWRFSTQDTMVVITILAAPASEPIGLTWDGAHLWVSDSIEHKIYAIDTSTASVVNSFASPGPAPTGLTWNGNYLLVSDCGTHTIYKLNRTTGGVVDSFPVPDSCPMGLAWKSSSSLWCVGADEARIYELKPSDGSVIRPFPAPGNSPTGLACDTDYLWVCDSGTRRVYKVNTVSGLPEQSFPSPGSSPMDISCETNYLWHADSYTEKLYKLQILTVP